MTQTRDIRFPLTLLSLIKSCETECVAGCCGLEAFNYSSNAMVPWVREKGFVAARAALQQLDDLIQELKKDYGEFVSTDMNAWWRPAQALDYFGEWREALVEAILLVQPEPPSSIP